MCAWAFVVCIFVFVILLFLSFVYFFSSLSYLYSDQHFHSNVNSVEGINRCAFAQWGVLLPCRNTILSQDMSPTSLTTSTTQRLLQWSSRMCPADVATAPSYLCDVELDDELIGKALSSPLFIQEWEEPADWRQAYHSHEESMLPAQSFFAHKSGETRVRTEFAMFVQRKSNFRLRKWANQDSPWKTKREFSLKLEPRFRNTNFKLIVIEEVSRNRMESCSLSKKRLIILLQVMNKSNEINYFKNSDQNKIEIFVKLKSKVFMRWKNWREFKSYEPINFREEDWSKSKHY